MAIVYKHTRIDTNQIFYIGIGNDTNRAYSTQGRNKHWKRIVNKTEFKVDILFEDVSWEAACEYERNLIQKYGRMDLNEGSLVNMTDGGDGQSNPSEETRKKLRDSKKNISDEYREKLSIAKRGELNHYYNKKRKDHSMWMRKNHPNKKTIIQYDIYGNFIKEWASARIVYNILGIHYKNISACCRNKRKSAGGYVWKFKQTN